MTHPFNRLSTIRTFLARFSVVATRIETADIDTGRTTYTGHDYISNNYKMIIATSRPITKPQRSRPRRLSRPEDATRHEEARHSSFQSPDLDYCCPIHTTT